MRFERSLWRKKLWDNAFNNLLQKRCRALPFLPPCLEVLLRMLAPSMNRFFPPPLSSLFPNICLKWSLTVSFLRPLGRELYDTIFRYSDWCNLWELIQGEPKRWIYKLLEMRMFLHVLTYWPDDDDDDGDDEKGDWGFAVSCMSRQNDVTQHLTPCSPFIFWRWSSSWCPRRCGWTWWWWW